MIDEIDHLNGITYFDHLSSLKRLMIEKKYRKAKKYWNRNKFSSVLNIIAFKDIEIEIMNKIIIIF